MNPSAINGGAAFAARRIWSWKSVSRDAVPVSGNLENHVAQLHRALPRDQILEYSCSRHAHGAEHKRRHHNITGISSNPRPLVEDGRNRNRLTKHDLEIC